MIFDVLKIIIDNEMVYKKEIAKEVGIQPETLDDVLRLLVERGYLRQEVTPTGDPKCAGCPMAGTCHEEGSSVTYYVTERGKQVVKQRK
ncbi:hypothetical protein EU537_09760 [Candidatus Thorarchaeota archaeon]|nr:MAG: hypothetical protein EU537_09760 [Candidatus Thorarchaeota archaeon]